jgi:hypothetical protein
MGAGSSKPEDASKHVFSRSVHFVPIRQPNSILVLNGAPTSVPTTPYRYVKEPYTDLPNPMQWHTCPVLQRTSRIPPSKLRSNTHPSPPKAPLTKLSTSTDTPPDRLFSCENPRTTHRRARRRGARKDPEARDRDPGSCPRQTLGRRS